MLLWVRLLLAATNSKHVVLFVSALALVVVTCLLGTIVALEVAVHQWHLQTQCI